MSKTVEKFAGGATRSDSSDRYDPEGYFSPIAWERIAEYLQKHQVQADGSIRESDNWQKGVPAERFMRGLWRHMLHLWIRHRGYVPMDPNAGEDIEEDLCAIAWNAQGMLHFILKAKQEELAARADEILEGH